MLRTGFAQFGGRLDNSLGLLGLFIAGCLGIGLATFSAVDALATPPTQLQCNDAISAGIPDLIECESVRAGPRVGGQRTVEVRYSDAIGTNIREQSVALIALSS